MSRREAPAPSVPASTSQTLDRGLQVLEAVAGGEALDGLGVRPFGSPHEDAFELGAVDLQ